MKLTKAQKIEKSKELAKLLKGADHLFVTEYQGLRFKDLDELRGRLRPLGARFRVLKNSVLKHALKEAGVPEAASSFFDGPNALLFGEQRDPISPAKILLKFAKENEALKLKGGFVDGRWMTPGECKLLSELGSKPELQAKLAGALYCAAAQSVWVLAAPLRDLVLVLKALEKKRSEAAA